MESAARMPNFGELHFGSAKLGDARRTRRLVNVADRIVQHPGGTLPQKLRGWAELMGLYRLVRAEAVTHAAVLQPHRQLVRHRMEQVAHGRAVLLIHDDTELDYTDRSGLPDLGQIGNGGGRGYVCHNTLAVTEDREVLGLAGQILHCRRAVPDGETPAQKRDHPQRESRLWLRGTEAGDGGDDGDEGVIGPAPSGCLWVDVADRGADTFEYLEHEIAHGRKFVIRCARDRKLAGEDHVAADRIHRKLYPYTRDLPTLGERTVRLAQTSRAKGQAGAARRVRVAAGPVSVSVPHFARGECQRPLLDLWVIHVREVDPESSPSSPSSPSSSGSEEPLEWMLLTNVPVGTLAQADRVIGWYELRPVIEEFHRGMKSGCGIENPQFQDETRLEPVIALLSVVAAALLNLRDLARGPDGDRTPATSVVPALFVTVLSAWRYRKQADAAAIPLAGPRDLSVREFCMALARLGGHLNRKSDGFPGWITLWRGWAALQLMVEGVEAFEALRCV